ncbi:GIY-YIG nuclease family protein [Capnocytophaga canimorsus]|uniref:GIY-YIG nuclease family protein n=1 Tax=Capnocytophaga canimorsus TaxID=28188 RepID=UPI00385FAD96
MFPNNNIPKIYAYQDERFEGCLKVGYTTQNDAAERVRQQQENINLPRQTWEIVLEEIATREDGTYFKDTNIHKRLEQMGFARIVGDKGKRTEFFQCSLNDVKAAILSEKKGLKTITDRTQSFGMRPEQKAAVEKTTQYFNSVKDEGFTPHFLWNAKMRFGKTFTAYQLALKMGWKKILVLTFKPAVLSAWREDLQNHIDFKDWQFVSNKEEDLSPKDIDNSKPFVYFGSFQDHLGLDKKSGGIKAKNEWVHQERWDCVIFDEYHFGAWRDKSKDLFGKEEKKELESITQEQQELEKEDLGKVEDFSYFDEELLPITTKHYLYLSGTPFRAIADGEFIEEQIYNWTYSDEQKAKTQWQGENNPYASLPRMVMMTYQLPEQIQHIAMKGEFNEFDLNVFFSAEGKGKNATFKYRDEVQKWLNLICGQFIGTVESDLKQGKNKPPMPFSDSRLLGILQHTFWFLPNVASCYAMANLLAEPQNKFFDDYKVIVCAGTEAGIGVDALKPVKEAMQDPLKTKTITLSCGKLTTGVSVHPWSGFFMLRNSSSPETYFQSIFRVQTPWVIKNPNGDSPNEEEIIKNECYVFDFAPNRALMQVAAYSERLNIDPKVSPEEKVAELVSFLPILAYDGSSMKEISPAEILDIASSGTSATLLARRWESALLVNVDNVTLQKLLSNSEALAVLEKIEGFRNLSQEIETIINRSEKIKKTKKEMANSNETIDSKAKKELTEEEIEYKDRRKQIQKKLIKFATRIPIFMYLSEHREQTLHDVITLLEPELFKKVTGITVKDFELLSRLGLFNNALMNDAVLKFKHYEDASLAYTGKPTYEGLRFVGAFDTIVPVKEYVQQ